MEKEAEHAVYPGMKVVYTLNRKVYTVTRINRLFLWLDECHRFTLKHFATLLKKGTYYEYIQNDSGGAVDVSENSR